MGRAASAPFAAYDKAQGAVQPRRQADATAFVKAARALEEAALVAADRARWRRAVERNQLLWTAVQIEIGLPRNPLPGAIKSNLAQLAAFVDRQSALALAGSDRGLLDPLIAIDREIAAGLFGRKR